MSRVLLRARSQNEGRRRGGGGVEWRHWRIPQSQSQIESAGANVLPTRCAAIYIHMNNRWRVKRPRAHRRVGGRGEGDITRHRNAFMASLGLFYDLVRNSNRASAKARVMRDTSAGLRAQDAIRKGLASRIHQGRTSPCQLGRGGRWAAEQKPLHARVAITFRAEMNPRQNDSVQLGTGAIPGKTGYRCSILSYRYRRIGCVFFYYLMTNTCLTSTY